MEQKVEDTIDEHTEDTRIVEIDIAPGYYSINHLLTVMVGLMSTTEDVKDSSGNYTTSKIAGEALITFAQFINESYEVSLVASSGPSVCRG
jgi:hypothetical protein